MMNKEEWLDKQSMYRNKMSISAIARRTGRDRKTVSKYVRQDSNMPRYKPRAKKPSILDPHKEYIRLKIDEHNLSVVYSRGKGERMYWYTSSPHNGFFQDTRGIVLKLEQHIQLIWMCIDEI